MGVKCLGESFAPGFGEEFDLEGAAGQFVRIWFVEIDTHCIGDGDFVLVLMDSNDFVSRADFSFAEDAQIETAAAAGQETLCHVVAIELQVQLEAGKSRLRYHHFGRADRETVSEADRVFDEPYCGEVFPEGPPGQIHTWQFLLPVGIVF